MLESIKIPMPTEIDSIASFFFFVSLSIPFHLLMVISELQAV